MSNPHTHPTKRQLFEYDCPTPDCGTLNQTYVVGDFVTCRKCKCNHLTYTLRDKMRPVEETVPVPATEATNA